MTNEDPETTLANNVAKAFAQFRRQVGATADEKPMTPADHYNEAVRLLAKATGPHFPYGTDDVRDGMIQEAQVHATLACVPRQTKQERR